MEAAAIPEAPERQPKTIDPGAQAMVDSLMVDLVRAGMPAGNDVAISLAGVRNYSHATADEYRAFLTELAALLNDACSDEGMRFKASEATSCTHMLLGSAYLVTQRGFDQWELYLRLTPREEAWTIWRPAGPVRVLRQARPGVGRVVWVSPTERQDARTSTGQ